MSGPSEPCADCGADTSKRGWSAVPGKGTLCDPCHQVWLKTLPPPAPPKP